MPPVARARAIFPVVTVEGPELLVLWVYGRTALNTVPGQLGKPAADAILAAFQALTLVGARGLAPRTFYQHAFEVTTLAGTPYERGLTGPSVGLAAFVALARLWANSLGRESEAAFTGRITRGESGWAVAGVRGVPQKAKVCEGRRLYFPEEDADVLPRRPEYAPVRDLALLLRGLGLRVPATLLLPLPTWRGQVREANRVVQFSTPTTIVGATASPWLALSAHMARLLAMPVSLATARDQQLAVELRVWMLVARQYGGGEVSDTDLDQLVEATDAAAPGVRGTVLALTAMCALIRAINVRAPDLAGRIRDAEGALVGCDARLLGRVRGTIGRAYLQDGRLDAALAHLTFALEHHADPEHEMTPDVPRSRLYLAQAHFHRGELEEAVRHLRAALTEIDAAISEGYDANYLATTRMFVQHQLAKTLAVAGVVLGEAARLMDAVDRFREIGGWSPRLRMSHLRTRAWIVRPDPAALSQCVAAIEALIAALPPEKRKGTAALLDEAGAAPTYGASPD